MGRAAASAPSRVREPDSASPAENVPDALVTLGSTAEDRLRLMQVTGGAPSDGFLLRSASSLMPGLPRDSATAARWALVAPEVQTVWNSALPFSLNDGAMWAGRGANLQLSGGVYIGEGRAFLILAPHLTLSENRDFQIAENPLYYRYSPFASVLHITPESIDTPSRFGDERIVTFSLGQSTLGFELNPITVGISTENQWWGPGIRNAIVMSNNAPGIPHLFLRTTRPAHTPVGTVEARWMVGILTESGYFDLTAANDKRSLSAFAATLTPEWEPHLTLGVARAVYAPVGDGQDAFFNLFDVVTDVGRPSNRPASDTVQTGPDEVFALFGRWIFPESGFEAYGEWARHERPASLRDFLISPNHTQGYTLGLQWARPIETNNVLRFQAELTNLEQSTTFRQRRVASYYTSRVVPQGYTHRGQVIGASIGPGASSQWIAADYFMERRQLGSFAGRIRWENDAYYRVYPFANSAGHDVSLFGGLRVSHPLAGFTISAEYTLAKRYNYLFQNTSPSFEDIRAVDVVNHTLQLRITPGRDVKRR